MGKKLVIYGAGDNGGLLAHNHALSKVFRDYELVGFVDDEKKGRVQEFPILGTGRDLVRLKAEGIDSIAVTLLGDSVRRLELCLELERMGFEFPSIYPQDMPREIQIGKGVYMHDSVALLGYDQRIGDFSIVGPFVVIEGRTNIGRGVILRPYSFVGHCSTIGEATAVGVRASVMPDLTIGRRCVIGPHVLQRRDMKEGERNLRFYSGNSDNV